MNKTVKEIYIDLLTTKTPNYKITKHGGGMHSACVMRGSDFINKNGTSYVGKDAYINLMVYSIEAENNRETRVYYLYPDHKFRITNDR